MYITGRQSKMARAALDLSRERVDELSGVRAQNIRNFEIGSFSLNVKNLETLQKTYEEHGVEFLENDGVRMKPTGAVRTLNGSEGFREFLENVYETVRNGGEINVSNVVDEEFKYWAGEHHEKHIKRMASISGLVCRTLCREGYTNFVSSEYSQYRWVPENEFADSSFYMYGDKLAIVTLKPEPFIIIISTPSTVEAFRKQFMTLWENAFAPEGT